MLVRGNARLSLSLLLGALAMFGAFPAAAQDVGAAQVIVLNVFGNNINRRMQEGQTLIRDQKVRTGTESAAELVFLDDSQLSSAPAPKSPLTGSSMIRRAAPPKEASTSPRGSYGSHPQPPNSMSASIPGSQRSASAAQSSMFWRHRAPPNWPCTKAPFRSILRLAVRLSAPARCCASPTPPRPSPLTVRPMK